MNVTQEHVFRENSDSRTHVLVRKKARKALQLLIFSEKKCLLFEKGEGILKPQLE